MARGTKRKSTGKRKATTAKRGSKRSTTMAAGRKTVAKRGKRKASRKAKKGGLRGLLSSLPLVS